MGAVLWEQLYGSRGVRGLAWLFMGIFFVEGFQFVFGFVEDGFLFGWEVFAGAVDVEVEHGHGGLVGAAFFAGAFFGGVFEGVGYFVGAF